MGRETSSAKRKCKMRRLFLERWGAARSMILGACYAQLQLTTGQKMPDVALDEFLLIRDSVLF